MLKTKVFLNKIIFLAIFLAIFFGGAGEGKAAANQLLLMDVRHTHTANVWMVRLLRTATNGNLYATSGSAFSKFNFPAGFPTGSLISPINYVGGKLYQRFEVLSKPSNKTVVYQICLFQDAVISTKHTCSKAAHLTFTSTGVYFANQDVSAMFQYSNIDWSRELLVEMLVMKDKFKCPIVKNSEISYTCTWDGSPDFSLYYPMDVRYTAMIIPAGGGQPDWPTTPYLDTPIFSPSAGAYTSPQNITITAPGATTIRYTLIDATIDNIAGKNGLEPEKTGAIGMDYNGPFQITSPKIITVKAWKDGYLPSSTVLAKYTFSVPDTVPPVRSNGQPTGLVSPNITLSLATDEAATCKYNVSADAAYDLMSSAPTASGTDHSWSLSGLSDGVKTYYVRCKDTAGNANTTEFKITFTVSSLPPVEAPVFSPASGTYAASQTVTISSATSGAVIHYTTDGSAPSASSPSLPNPVTISSTSTLKALATKAATPTSPVTSGVYEITAASTASTGIVFEKTSSLGTIDELVASIVNWLLGITSVLVILFLIVGGIMYLGSSGDEERIRQAKRIINYAIIGLVIILVSYAVVITLNEIIFN